MTERARFLDAVAHAAGVLRNSRRPEYDPPLDAADVAMLDALLRYLRSTFPAPSTRVVYDGVGLGYAHARFDGVCFVLAIPTKATEDAVLRQRVRSVDQGFARDESVSDDEEATTLLLLAAVQEPERVFDYLAGRYGGAHVELSVDLRGAAGALRAARAAAPGRSPS